MQYNHPDLMFDVKLILSHAFDPSALEFKGIKNLIHYLDIWTAHTIPSCISLDLMSLPPITSVKSFTKATYNPKIYPRA